MRCQRDLKHTFLVTGLLERIRKSYSFRESAATSSSGTKSSSSSGLTGILNDFPSIVVLVMPGFFFFSIFLTKRPKSPPSANTTVSATAKYVHLQDSGLPDALRAFLNISPLLLGASVSAMSVMSFFDRIVGFGFGVVV